VIPNAALLIALAIASPAPSPSTTFVVPAAASPAAAPAPTSQPAPPASTAPSLGPSGAPSAPAPAATTSPSPSPYRYRFVPRQPDHPEPGATQILAVSLNDQQLHSRGPIAIKVETSPDVVKVVSKNGSQEGNIPMIAPGDFEAASTLPKIPFIARGISIRLEFIATAANGQTATVKVPVKIL
jgi:hypothetical protein